MNTTALREQLEQLRALQAQQAHHDPLEAALSALEPARSYAAPPRHNWEKERLEGHPHHRTAHTTGLLMGHLAHLAPQKLGRPLTAHTRRVLAHLFHGLAHGIHPGNSHD